MGHRLAASAIREREAHSQFVGRAPIVRISLDPAASVAKRADSHLASAWDRSFFST